MIRSGSICVYLGTRGVKLIKLAQVWFSFRLFLLKFRLDQVQLRLGYGLNLACPLQNTKVLNVRGTHPNLGFGNLDGVKQSGPSI